MTSHIETTLQAYNKAAKQYAEYSFSKISQYELTQFSSFIKGKNVLDAGCGAGRDTQYLREEGFTVMGIDASEGMIKEAKDRVGDDFKVMDIRKLEFKDQEFDGIWCCATLHHIPKKELPVVLKEFSRVLKTNGVLYVAVKEGEGEKIVQSPKVQNEPRFYAFYKQIEFESELKQNGFDIINAYIEDIEGVQWLNIFAKKK